MGRRETGENRLAPENSKFKRLIFLAVLIILPITAIAAPSEGDRASTGYEDILVGSDGLNFIRDGVQKSVGYNSKGETYSFLHDNYDGPRKHYKISVEGQGAWWGYCIEQGVRFPDSQAYEGLNSQNDKYFTNLPDETQEGILLAALYGRQPGRSVPVAGCNDDDWYWATQVIIWEYQQLLRSGPEARKSNGLVPGDYFYSTLAGRPAEKCYLHILQRIRLHQTKPAFASRNKENAPEHLLKRTGNQGPYLIELRDGNGSDQSMKSDRSDLVRYKGDGWYLIQTDEQIESTLISFTRNISLPSHELLVWGSESPNQAIITGTKDPCVFFLKVRSEDPGELILDKSSEDGRKEGFQFNLEGPDGDVATGITNTEGKWKIMADPGTYLLTEDYCEGYLPLPPTSVEITENHSTEVQVHNSLDRRPLILQKTDRETGLPVTTEGIVFEINGVRWVTDASGQIRIVTGLPFGEYRVTEIKSPLGYSLSNETLVFHVNQDSGSRIDLCFPNSPQKGRITLHKSGQIPESRGIYVNLSGAEYRVEAAEDIITPDGTIRAIKGTVVDRMLTGIDGQATSAALYPGKYILYEETSPSGYIRTEGIAATVEIDANDSGEEEIEIGVYLTNEPKPPPPVTGDPGQGVPSTPGFLILLALIAFIWWHAGIKPPPSAPK